MKIHYCEQRSEDWYKARSGKFTASDFGKLMPSSRQGMNDWNKTQMDIIYRVAAERLTGQPVGSTYVSQAMQHGIDTEDTARVAYEMETGNVIEQVGFIEYSEWIGCSPDGLGLSGPGLEIKCPDSDTHLRYMYCNEDLVEDYYWQCVGGMLCSGRKQWDLYSFDDRFRDPSKRSVLVPVEWNQADVDRLEKRLAAATAKAIAIIGEQKGAMNVGTSLW
jgi:hypothetical protein